MAQYRVNHPDYLIGRPESLSNLPMMYGIPTYAGEDSDVPSDYLGFLQAFDPDPDQRRWYQRAGIITELHGDRILDLLGVRYDVLPSYVLRSDKGIVPRPNALARLSLFRRFEVIPDRKAALARLKDPAFDPTTTLILDHDPGWTAGAGERFIPMPYQQKKSELIDLSYDEASPSVLLFDDTYSPLWRAEVDGAAVPIYRGNVNFMAVNLPPGKHRLALSFVPVLFYRLAGLSIGGTILLLLLAGYLAVTAGAGRHGRSRFSPARGATDVPRAPQT